MSKLINTFIIIFSNFFSKLKQNLEGKKMFKLTITSIVILLLIFSNSFAQENLENKLERVGKVYAQKYIEPLNNALGANFNTGFFNNAYVPFDKEKPADFNISFSLKFFGSFLSEKDRAFDLTYSDSVEVYPGHFELATYTVTNAPTVLGSTSNPIATGTYDSTGVTLEAPTQELIGGILNTGIVPFAVPQLDIGTIYGTDAAIRFYPQISVADFGSFGLIGFAVRHNISHYIENMPFDIALQFAYQYFNIKDNKDANILSSNSIMTNLQLSKQLYSFLNIYGGIQYERFSSDVEYTYTSETGTKHHYAFNQIGDNKFRGILGFNMQFGVFNFNTDINIGNRFVLSSGMGVGF